MNPLAARSGGFDRSRLVERVETVDADTGPSTGGSFSISNTTVVILDGQHSGSEAAYRVYSARTFPSASTVTRLTAPSERLSIGCGESVPTKTPRAKTNSWYSRGRHMPS
jgi:hypothetical protein